MSKRKYNLKPSFWRLSTPRYGLHCTEAQDARPLPAKASNRAFCPQVFNQGQVGSCTGNGACFVFDYLELMELRAGLPVDQAPEEFVPTEFDLASRLYFYFNERAIEGTTDQDAGASMQTTMLAASQYGICRESLWPYDESKVFTKPSDDAYAEGSKHKQIYGFRLTSVEEMKRCIANGFVFIAGIMVYDSFESDAVAQTGMVPMPQPWENLQGGHCISVVGYDDERSLWICRNSWGSDWGDGGYFYLPYTFVENRDLFSDAITFRRTPSILVA